MKTNEFEIDEKILYISDRFSRTVTVGTVVGKTKTLTKCEIKGNIKSFNSWGNERGRTGYNTPYITKYDAERVKESNRYILATKLNNYNFLGLDIEKIYQIKNIIGDL